MISLLAAAALLTIIDGDTFKLGDETVRIAGIDTPEIDWAHCRAEVMLGKLAKAEAERLLRAGPVELVREGKDRYGRTLARVTVNGVDVGQALIERGYAAPWAGKREPWCATRPRYPDLEPPGDL